MFNITDMMQAAHGGDAINTLSRQFGLQPAQTQRAVDALLPALTVGLQKQTEANASFAALMTTMLTGDHARFFEQPAAAAQPEAAQAGQHILQQLFGAHTQAMNQQVAQHASALSGISQQILAQMLPVLASMIMGAMFQNATNGGGGGLFGQFLNAARGAGVGGLGGMFKQPFPQAPISQPVAGQPSASQPAQGGGLGGGLGGLSSWFNTVSEPAAPAQPQGAAPTPAPGSAAPQINPMSVGLDALRNMFQTSGAAQQKSLNDFQTMFEQMTGARR